MLDDGQPHVASLRRLKLISWIVLWMFVVGNLAYPVYLCVGKLRQCLLNWQPAGKVLEADETLAACAAQKVAV